jgi:hypothetical protein
MRRQVKGIARSAQVVFLMRLMPGFDKLGGVVLQDAVPLLEEVLGSDSSEVIALTDQAVQVESMAAKPVAVQAWLLTINALKCMS